MKKSKALASLKHITETLFGSNSISLTKSIHQTVSLEGLGGNLPTELLRFESSASKKSNWQILNRKMSTLVGG